MIAPKTQKPTAREEAEAYELATLRDRGVCQRCHRDCGEVQRDHRKNRSQGGLTIVVNLQLLGMGCHDWKTRHPEAAAVEGWACPAWADPATYPARRYVRHGFTYRQVWVLYTADGAWVEISDSQAIRRVSEGRMYSEVSA